MHGGDPRASPRRRCRPRGIRDPADHRDGLRPHGLAATRPGAGHRRRWNTAALLFSSSLVGVAPGAWLSSRLSPAVLSILVGGLVVIALATVVADERARVFRGAAGGAAAGATAGCMNVTAGVGGPPIVLYRLSTDWAQRPYVATVQAYFIALNVASLVVRGAPRLDASIWVVVLAALVIGLALGEQLAGRISDARARAAIVIVALAGAVSIVIEGVLAL